MDEKVFFEMGDVKVTNARFVSRGQTYAMSNVTSVKTFVEEPKRFWPILILIFGVLALLSATTLGVICIIVSGIWLYTQKTLYHIKLATASGETSALVAEKREYVDQIVAALNEAIVHRG